MFRLMLILKYSIPLMLQKVGQWIGRMTGHPTLSNEVSTLHHMTSVYKPWFGCG